MAFKTLLPLIALFLFTLTPASARTWTSLKGDHTIEGEAIAFGKSTVIIKRVRSERLVAVEINELSEADQRFIERRRQQMAEEKSGDAESWQTWTSRKGFQIRGRVLAYGRGELTINVQRGVVTVNGKAFSSLDSLHQRVLLAVLSALEKQNFDDEKQLTRWARGLLGQPKSYTLEGVRMRLESGDEIAVPFFLFSDNDLEVLRPGWEAWLEAEDSEATRQREDFLMQQEAMYYQATRQQQQQHQQMEVLKLNMLGAIAGVTSIWKVGMRPRPGVWGRPMTVMVSAENSQIATQMALRQHPGYYVWAVAKSSR